MKLSSQAKKIVKKPVPKTPAKPHPIPSEKGPVPGDGPGVGGGYFTVDNVDVALEVRLDSPSIYDFDDDGPGVGGGYIDRAESQGWVFDDDGPGDSVTALPLGGGYASIGTQEVPNYQWTGSSAVEPSSVSLSHTLMNGKEVPLSASDLTPNQGWSESVGLDWGSDSLSYHFSGL